MIKKNQKGAMLIEVVIGTAVFLFVMLASAGAFTLTLAISLANTANIQSAYLMEEGLEAARIIRDSGWTVNIGNLNPNTAYYFTYNAGSWAISNQNTYIDGVFERKVFFEDVRRDSSQNIVQSGGTLDNNTKKVVVRVSWIERNATTTKSVSTYITNIHND